MCQQADWHMRNHIVSLWNCGYRGLFCGFHTLILTDFSAFGTIMRTGNHARPETLLAAVGTVFTEVVILPPAVLAQEKRPF